MSDDPKLDEFRARINEIDEQLVRLISDRAGLALKVAEVKFAREEKPILYRPEREAQVLRGSGHGSSIQ